MKNYNIIFFDLDGTLVDTGLGVINSVIYSLKKFGIEVDDRNSLNKFIGPPLHKSFENYYGFSSEKAMKAVEYYREYYTDKGIFEVKLYENMNIVLETLKSMKKMLVVATSKPEIFAEKVLEYIDIRKYFDIVAGSNLDGSRTEKSEVIRYAINKCSIDDISDVIMIGDRHYDISGANEVGIDSIGAVFGYGSYCELKNAGATYIVDNPNDILNLLIRI